jgi:hypothetical protein
VYQVQLGAGMGSTYAGDASDLHFFALCEKNFALLPAVQLEFGIEFYGRFKDDGIIILSDARKWPSFWLKFKAFASEYKMSLDCFSREEAVFSDVRIFKDSRFRDSCKFDYGLHVKPSSVWLPLSPWSSHSQGVHNSWPQSQISRFVKRFSNFSRAVVRQQEFRENYYRLFGLVLPKEEAFTHETHAVRPIRSWLVIPFNQCWARANLGKELNSIEKPHSMAPVGAASISWRLGNPHLVHALRKFGMSSL